MKRRFLVIAAAALPLAAAGVYAGDKAGAGDSPPAAHDADNTGKNARDSKGNTLTSFDQGGSEADREISAAIRKALVDNDQLSMNAHNVKIITRDGQVTLRGPVKSPAEKTSIANVAAKTNGVKGVDNQLEIERKP